MKNVHSKEKNISARLESLRSFCIKELNDLEEIFKKTRKDSWKYYVIIGARDSIETVLSRLECDCEKCAGNINLK